MQQPILDMFFFFMMATFWPIFRLKNSLKIVFWISCMHFLMYMFHFFTQHGQDLKGANAFFIFDFELFFEQIWNGLSFGSLVALGLKKKYFCQINRILRSLLHNPLKMVRELPIFGRFVSFWIPAKIHCQEDLYNTT